MMTKAPTSAAPLNAPRQAALPTSIKCRFMVGQQLKGTLQFGYRGRPLIWTELRISVSPYVIIRRFITLTGSSALS